MYQKKLQNDFEIRQLTKEEFHPLWTEHAKKIFEDNTPILYLRDCLNEDELGKEMELNALMGSPLRINLGLFKNKEFVGWSWGFQESSQTFYMCNSAILPAYRRRGLYTGLMNSLIDLVVAEGFQRIYSRHVITNNAVIIPKLKRGFHITHFELSPAFGTLIQLSYFPKATFKKILDYRAGQIRPDEEIKRLLKI